MVKCGFIARDCIDDQKLTSLLRSSGVRDLVYISCDANAALKNFVSLARPTSNAFPGDPFLPRKVVPVDLFPHTNHFELIVHFQRVSFTELMKSGDGEQS